MVKVHLQTVTMDIKPQDVTVRADAVTYFNVANPVKTVVAIQDYQYATSDVAQTTLRSVLGQAELDELLVNP